MSIVREFIDGVTAYGKAIKLIVKHKLTAYFLLPLVINILLFLGGLHLIDLLTVYVEKIIAGWVDKILPDLSWNTYLAELGHIFLWLIFKVIYVALFAFFGGYIVLVIMSPVLAILSEKTEAILTGRTYPFKPAQLVKDIFRGILIATRNLLLELMWIILLFFLGMFPGLNVFTPIGLFLVSAYFYGFSFMDYSNERKKRSITEGSRFIKRHKGLAIANGTVFSVFLFFPFVGVLVGSFLSVVAVVAATINMVEAEERIIL